MAQSKYDSLQASSLKETMDLKAFEGRIVHQKMKFDHERAIKHFLTTYFKHIIGRSRVTVDMYMHFAYHTVINIYKLSEFRHFLTI